MKAFMYALLSASLLSWCSGKEAAVQNSLQFERVHHRGMKHHQGTSFHAKKRLTPNTESDAATRADDIAVGIAPAAPAVGVSLPAEVLAHSTSIDQFLLSGFHASILTPTFYRIVIGIGGKIGRHQSSLWSHSTACS